MRCLCLVSHRKELAQLKNLESSIRLAIYVIPCVYNDIPKNITSKKLKYTKRQNLKNALWFVNNVAFKIGDVKVRNFIYISKFIFIE